MKFAKFTHVGKEKKLITKLFKNTKLKGYCQTNLSIGKLQKIKTQLIIICI
jgi:hypothetical protein